MAHNKKHVSQPAASGQGSGRRLGHVLLVMVASLLLIMAVPRIRHIWKGLPAVNVDGMDWSAIQRANQQIRGEAQEALVLVMLSNHFTRGLHYPDEVPRLLSEMRTGVAAVRHSQLPRLHLVAMTLCQLEVEGVPPDQWWSRIEHYLAGLDDRSASFEHFLPSLFDEQVKIYQRFGMTPGTAQQVALLNFDAVHGPFLQHLTAGLQRVAEDRRRAGDLAAGDTCDAILERVLRTWASEPGPPSVRLLAADLLIRREQARSEEASVVVEELGRWREVCRDNAVRAGLPAAPLHLAEAPTVAYRAGRDLQPSLTWLAWLLSVQIPLALLTLIAIVLTWKRRNSRYARRHRVDWLIDVFAAGLVLASITILNALADEFVHADLLRLDAFLSENPARTGLGLPWCLTLGLLLGVVLAAVLVLIALRPRVNAALAGGMAARLGVIWLVMAVALWLGTFVVDSWRRGYDAQLAAPLSRHMAALAEPDPAAWVDQLMGRTP